MQRQSQRDWYLKNRERILPRLWGQYQEQHDRMLADAKQRQATPCYRAKEQQRRERPAARLKQRARSAAYRALTKGLLVRQPCEVCGGLDVQMHHDDYDKPLDVRWFCRQHHFHRFHRYVEVRSA